MLFEREVLLKAQSMLLYRNMRFVLFTGCQPVTLPVHNYYITTKGRQEEEVTIRTRFYQSPNALIVIIDSA
jgi:hypothetical protein